MRQNTTVHFGRCQERLVAPLPTFTDDQLAVAFILSAFLLKKCGNDIHHPVLRSVVALRDSPPAGGMTEVVARLSALKDTANAAGETKQAAAFELAAAKPGCPRGRLPALLLRTLAY